MQDLIFHHQKHYIVITQFPDQTLSNKEIQITIKGYVDHFYF